ncbi:MAG: efflux RND transporter periplasmic adaptor subunit [bacterium]
MMMKHTSMRARRAMHRASFLLLTLGGVACGRKESSQEGVEKRPAGADAPASPASLAFTAAQIQHGGVRWSAVTVGSSAGSATIPGTLTVNEDRTERLSAPGRGRVTAVRVQPGDRVSRGQALVTMLSTDAGMAQSDVAKATAEVTSRRAQAQYAASAHARAERLLAIKAIPRQDYERAIADDEQARAALAQGEAELHRARSTAAQLGALGAGTSGEVVLPSPMAGVVLSRSAQPGAVVEAGSPLVVVTDPSSLWLQVKAPEQLSSLFAKGGVLRFTVPAYPAESFTARIDAVGAGLEPETRTLAVRGVVSNATGRLKSEMLATVFVDGGPLVPAILIPDDAVQLIQGKPTVFIAHPDGKGGARFEQREVEIGARSGGRVSVTRGLLAGDIVVSAGAFAVKAEFQKGTMPKMEM